MNNKAKKKGDNIHCLSFLSPQTLIKYYTLISPLTNKSEDLKTYISYCKTTFEQISIFKANNSISSLKFLQTAVPPAFLNTLSQTSSRTVISPKMLQQYAMLNSLQLDVAAVQHPKQLQSCLT